MVEDEFEYNDDEDPVDGDDESDSGDFDYLDD